VIISLLTICLLKNKVTSIIFAKKAMGLSLISSAPDSSRFFFFRSRKKIKIVYFIFIITVQQPKISTRLTMRVWWKMENFIYTWLGLIRSTCLATLIFKFFDFGRLLSLNRMKYFCEKFNNPFQNCLIRRDIPTGTQKNN
jgi:hypothetical protein